ncbi:Monoamine oxidase [Lysobacter dokdonensis DS-58]|uniref:Monoamine oxidase n=1 Tax=Lysobacter dokdonensis DS-58 TaxID=1300345 RepID=A0A0A2WDH2_9GAMM|nr:NAD(P)/FAD-dependent oxidoreductase [Lysobacter dokdonensis]KGQ18256.1 Monoamine oxidase [Lysobacter dokdonensis DS-58]
MARTPLFALLQRAARIARNAARVDMPLDEFHERGMELRVDATRRRLLQGAAASLALTACAPIVPRAINVPEVAIVGAGIAGLSAAWALRAAGVPARVYEAQSRVGGRMLSLRDHFPNGQVIELGGELIDTGHTRIRTLAQELGLELDDLLAGETAADTWWFDGRRIGETEIVRAFAPLAQAIVRDVESLGDGALDHTDANPAFRALDAMSVADWLDKHQVSGWLRKLIDVAYTTEMGLEIDEQSALNFLTFIGTEDADAFKIFGESDERFHVRGGNDLIPRTLATRMAGSIETGHMLEAVRAEGEGFRLTFAIDDARIDMRAQHVILALPFTLLRNVQIDIPLPARKRNAIDRLAYGTNAKLMIGYDRRAWRAHDANGASMSDLPYQTTWDTSRKQPGEAGTLTNFTGGRHGVELGKGTPRMQADAATAALDRVWPGLAALRTNPREARFHWPTHPWSMGSYACLRPNDWSTLRGVMGESVGRLHFAGEHCALDTQGFMEGGCESGQLAAQAVLDSLRPAAAAGRFPIQRRRTA